MFRRVSSSSFDMSYGMINLCFDGFFDVVLHVHVMLLFFSVKCFMCFLWFKISVEIGFCVFCVVYMFCSSVVLFVCDVMMSLWQCVSMFTFVLLL